MLRGHQECLQECKSYMGPIPVSFSKEYKMYLLILLVARLGKFVECDTSSSTASMTGKAKDSWHEEGSREESRKPRTRHSAPDVSHHAEQRGTLSSLDLLPTFHLMQNMLLSFFDSRTGY
ncbi:uncharacterized protein LOC122156641 isoform X4 [Centrocercus urophasianus]|uniref:uncharacterized protein LOC122156641 isoform X4 n=1 Tax=Centrocercus urophasianus TaxID=9002 RepID=UPI001C64B32E|nr:uncharacterized protein LOC122156641 isoform X4 [Centrocercus urophasianus]